MLHDVQNNIKKCLRLIISYLAVISILMKENLQTDYMINFETSLVLRISSDLGSGGEKMA